MGVAARKLRDAAGAEATPEPRGGEVRVWLARDRERRLLPAVAELLFEGRGLARRLGAALVAMGDLPPDAEENTLLARWGVARVRALGVPLPPHPPFPGGASPLAGLLDGVQFRAALFAADALGRAAAPLFAEEAGAVFLPGVSGLTTDGAAYVAARPTLGGQYEAVTRVALTSPVVATLLPGAVGEAAAVERDVRSAGDRAPTLPTLEPPPARLVPIEAPPQMLAPDPGSLELADAERIVAFGRGAFHPEAVALVERLARALGAVVAGTRPAADEGWLPFSRQVGLTGAIVTPRLYVAVGISGAPYHLVGVKDPETLIAVNRDPEAPIFASAHLGLVGDLYEVLPALLERLEAGGPGVSLPGGGRLRGEGTDGGRRP